ncbi:MAG: hypothetical protein JSV65_01550 [Armatimonadota bacterium]|nr:MAG: hypothetical protein JSV65_01550 [Armatimonadota bacterium]
MSKRRQRSVHDGMGTLIFGIVFTIVGAGLLIERIANVDVWEYLWRLWPVLLIVMGVKILVDHYASRPAEGGERQ